MGYRSRLLFAAGLCWLWASPAAAEEAIVDVSIESNAGGVSAESVQPAEPASSPVHESGWQFTAGPYLWMAGLKGDIGVSSAVEPVAVDQSFGDILKNLKFAAMASFEARNGRFVGSADVMLINLGATGDFKIREVDLLDGDLKARTFVSTLTAGYRWLDEDRLFFDIFGGGRINSMKTSLELAGPQRSFSGSKTETWLDPVIGARFQMPLGPNWSLQTYGDIGGFGVGSHFTWQLSGVVQHDLSRRWSLSAGWRHLKSDFENDGFVFDAAMDGPILGAVYRF